MLCSFCNVNTPFAFWADGVSPSHIVCPKCGAIIDVDDLTIVKKPLTL